MKRYLNWQRETIDELDSAEFATMRDFRREMSRLLLEYSTAGMPGAYWSQRPFGGWK